MECLTQRKRENKKPSGKDVSEKEGIQDGEKLKGRVSGRLSFPRAALHIGDEGADALRRTLLVCAHLGLTR